MEIRAKTVGPKAEEVALISKQLAILQEYITLKFGSEFEDFYRSRLQPVVPSQYSLLNKRTKDESSEFEPMTVGQRQNMGVIINPSIPNNQNQIYYSFEDSDGGAGAFTISDSQVQIQSGVSTSAHQGSTNTLHGRNDKGGTKKKRAVKVIFSCQKRGCRESFPTEELLMEHVTLMHSERSLFCGTLGCNLEFASTKLRQYHEYRCLLKPHKCKWEGCEKTFKTSKLLHGHISAVHRRSDRAIHKCSIPGCDKAFPDKLKLNVHETRCRWKFNYEADPDFGKDDDTLAANRVSHVSSSATTATGDPSSVFRDDGNSGCNYNNSQMFGSGGASSSIPKTETDDMDISNFLYVKTEILDKDKGG